MKKTVVYILTWFPMYSESFIYNEIRGLIKLGCPVDTAVALHKKHDDVQTGMDTLRVIYPPSFSAMLKTFFVFLLCHPVTFVQLTIYLAAIHKGELFTLKRGTTSFVRGFLLLPLVLWIHRQLGDRPIHFHAHFTVMATTTAMLLAKLRKTTFSFTGHGSDVLTYVPKNLSRRINDARFMITVSHYNKKYIRHHFPDADQDNIHVFPAGIDTSKFRAIREPADDDFQKEVRLITVGRLSPEKGHAVFIRALARFYRAYPALKYTLIGDGSQRETLEDLVKSCGLENNVAFLGFQNREFIIDALHKSDLFVLTSYSEGFPVVLMEAAASGLPILATNITAVPEIVVDGTNGMLVESGNEDDMFRALQALSENNWEKMKQLTQNAQDQDLHHIEEKNTIAGICNLMNSVIAPQ